MSDGPDKSEELETRIRELCAKAIVTQDTEGLRLIFEELRATMAEKMRIGRLRLAQIQAAEQQLSKKHEPDLT